MRKIRPDSRVAALVAMAAALLGGCAHTLPTQPAAPVARAPEPARPAAAQKAVAAPVAQTAVAAPAPPAETPQTPAVSEAERSVGLPKPDTYVVQAGDTLALIARRPEIYGDASMWMMLYRGNLSQIASVDWLCPGQVLSVPRNFSEADVKAVREEALRRAPWPPGAKATPIYFCRGLPASSGAAAAPAKPADAAARKSAGGVTGKARAPVAPQPAAAAGTSSADGPAKSAGATPPRAPVAEATAIAPAGQASAVPAANGAAAAPAAGTGSGRTGVGAASSAAARGETAAAPTTPTPVTVGLSRDAFRDAARRAYNVGDMPWATYYYRQHLQKSPRDAAALGELGNIYYRAGNLAVAAGLYYDAARVLIDRGNRSRAAQLLLAVSEGNPALADDLYARLMAPAPR